LSNLVLIETELIPIKILARILSFTLNLYTTWIHISNKWWCYIINRSGWYWIPNFWQWHGYI